LRPILPGGRVASRGNPEPLALIAGQLWALELSLDPRTAKSMRPIHMIRNIVTSPLNRGTPLRAMWRFAKWQVASRLAPGEIVVSWANDSKFLASPGEHGVTCNIYSGFFEFEDMGYLVHALRPEDLFADIGANVGSYSILACAVCGARGYAFEPVPNTYHRLLKNLRLNDIDQRVVALHRGVGAASGQLRFSTEQTVVNHVLTDEEKDVPSVEVPVVTLDEVLAEPPTMMKIDVEGFETRVLEGAERTLREPQLHSLLIELNGSGRRYGFDDDKIAGVLEGAGFRAYEYRPFDRELNPLSRRRNTDGNTLYIRDIDLMRQRVATAPKVRIMGREF
jgi:FkbM family methyltransferase